MAVSLPSTAAHDSDECEFPTPFHLRIRQGRPPRATRRWDQLDSSPAVESNRNSKITRADKIAIVSILTSSLESGIERHAAIDEERRTLNVIGLVARQPDCGSPNFLRLPDSLVRDELKQFIVMLGCIPGLHVN